MRDKYNLCGSLKEQALKLWDTSLFFKHQSQAWSAARSLESGLSEWRWACCHIPMLGYGDRKVASQQTHQLALTAKFPPKSPRVWPMHTERLCLNLPGPFHRPSFPRWLLHSLSLFWICEKSYLSVPSSISTNDFSSSANHEGPHRPINRNDYDLLVGSVQPGAGKERRNSMNSRRQLLDGWEISKDILKQCFLGFKNSSLTTEKSIPVVFSCKWRMQCSLCDMNRIVPLPERLSFQHTLHVVQGYSPFTAAGCEQSLSISIPGPLSP